MERFKEKSKHSVQEMFLNARQKSANDWELGKKMLDTVIGTLKVSSERVRRINECRHLAAGKWPEMEDYLGKSDVILKDKDGEGRSFGLDDFIVHHGKINNVTQWIKGDIITQPLIAIVKDFSAFGRRYREQEQVQKLRAYYYDNVWVPQATLIQQEYFQKENIKDPMSLTPDEQKQVQADLQDRIKRAIPREVMDDLKKVKTPDEKIRQTLLNYDIKAYEIEEKFIQGGEEAVDTNEEYYLLGKKGVRPTFDVLNTSFVNWAGSENTDYSEDGVMATYDKYTTPHDFVMQWGRQVIEKKHFLDDVSEWFSEIPGYYRDSSGTGGDIRNEDLYKEDERDFTEFVGANPGAITENWRTRAGQDQIAALYTALSRYHGSGRGIRQTYGTWKWTEEVTYVQRYVDGKIEEYFFSADYKKDKSQDIMIRKFPANRVYHGTKIADKFYVGIGPVEWQYYGNVNEWEPKLTIYGRRYARSNGSDEDRMFIGPGAIQAQLRFNISASKMEELERNDLGKIMLWNTSMKPPGWGDDEYIAMMMKLKNVPYSTVQTGSEKNAKPFYIEDGGSSSKLEEYRNSMMYWENEIYKQMGVNRDILGSANQYQSNALTQSNIQGANKQLLPFHNRRRLVKQRVLNAFNNLSLISLLDDPEKQAMLLDDFSRLHLMVNEDQVRALLSALFIIDDYAEAQDVERIRAQVLTMMQQGTPLKDVIAVMRSKSVNEMYEVAEIAQIQAREDMQDERQARMAELQLQQKNMMDIQKFLKDKEEMSKERDRQVKLELAEIDAGWALNAADVDQNKTADSLQKAREEIQSREKIEADKRRTELEKEHIKASAKNKN